MRMMKESINSFILLSVLFTYALSLSVLMQNQDPYCFSLMVKKTNVIKASYMMSGLNEDQIEFRVRNQEHFFMLNGIGI